MVSNRICRTEDRPLENSAGNQKKKMWWWKAQRRERKWKRKRMGWTEAQADSICLE